MEKTTVTKIIIRLLYTASTLYYVYQLYEQSSLVEAPQGLQGIITYFSIGLSLTAILSTRLYWTTVLSLLILFIFNPVTGLIPFMFPIIVIAYIHRYSTDITVTSKGKVVAGAVISTLIYASFALTGYVAGIILYKALLYKPPLTGDAAVVVSVFSTTLAFKILVSSILLAFLFKALSSLLGFMIALTSRGEVRLALYNEIVEREGERLLEFKGTQYGSLEWGMSLLLTLLIAPLVYRPITSGMSILMSSLGFKPGVISLIGAIVTTIIAWIPVKTIVVALVRTIPLKSILKPSYSGAIIGVVMATTLFLAISLATGYDIILLLRESVTGRPLPQPDPLNNLLTTPGADYYRKLARILDLIVRLFWG